MAAVDRLSSLPPELLADVFGLAAEHSTPLKEPLSRTLLPYFRETLYRRVHFASEKSLSRFAAAILAQPFLGLLVRELRAPTGWPRVEHHARNTGLVHHLTRLLYLDNVTFEFDAIHFSSFSRLSQLRSLSYKCTGLGPRHLEQLVHLVSLTSLEIRFFTTDACELESARFESLELPQVTHLSLKCLDTWLEDTRNSWDRHFARFVDRFPRLESLTLDDVRMPRFSGILGHLSIATQTLKSLVLRSPASGPALPSYRCDHFLPRFRHLELVDLCQHTVSHALGIFLAQLPELAFLRLGPNTHFDIDAQALVATIGDPRQTPSLQLFKFDAIWGAYGKPLQPDAVQFFTLRGDGWVEPRLGEWELDDLHRLDEVAQRRGVKLSGSSFEAEALLRRIDLERSNRCIICVYRMKSFEDYIGWRTWPDLPVVSYLPDLDLDSLDLDNVELVQVEVPEAGWHLYTLRQGRSSAAAPLE